MKITKRKANDLYNDCYVAIIDILGFKKLVETKNSKYIHNLFNEFFASYNIEYKKNNESILWVSNDIVKMIVSSDTICLYIASSEEDALGKLIAACAYFQVRMMRLQDPILTRGAIVKDNLFADEDIFFGPGINKAYLLEEKTAITPRIILTKSLINDCQASSTDNCKEYINTYTYEDTDKFYCIDSVFLFYGLNHGQIVWSKFVKHINNVIDSETDTSIRQKHIYVDYQIKRSIEKYKKKKQN